MGIIFSNKHTRTGSNLFIQLLVQGWNLLPKASSSIERAQVMVQGFRMDPLSRDFPGSRSKGHLFTDGPWYHRWVHLFNFPPFKLWVLNFFFRKLFLHHSCSLFVRMAIILITYLYFSLGLYFSCSLMKWVWSASRLVKGRFTFWFSVTHNTARKQLMGVIKTPHWNNFCLFCFL